MSSLLRRIASSDELYLAWHHVQAVNKPTSKGIDGVSVADFGQALRRNIGELRRKVRASQYEFQKLIPVPIEKQPGKYRPLAVPAVRDRVVMRAMYNVAAPSVREIANKCTYGYVPGRRREDAVAHIRRSFSEGRRHVLEADIRNFFDEVDRKALLEALSAFFSPDSDFWPLLQSSVHIALDDCSHLTEVKRSAFPEPGIGIPQGGGLSPFFANVFLLPLDRAMQTRSFDMVRWADDFVVLCQGGREGCAAYDLAREVLEEHLHLRLHPLETSPNAKTRVTSFAQGFDFLGLRFDAGGVRPAREKRDVFFHKIAEGARQSTSVRELLHGVHLRVVAWTKAYTFCAGPRAEKLWAQIDGYVLEHVVKNLRRLGMDMHALQTSDLPRVLGLPRTVDIIRRRAA